MTEKKTPTGDENSTPWTLYRHINAEFGFTIDVCASEDNHKADRYWTKDQDALKQCWTGEVCWMNPPFSVKEVRKFVKKARDEALRGAVVVALVRHDPTSQYFKDYIWNHAVEVRMLARRVRFEGHQDDYNFPCCLVIWTPDPLQVSTRVTYWDWPIIDKKRSVSPRGM